MKELQGYLLMQPHDLIQSKVISPQCLVQRQGKKGSTPTYSTWLISFFTLSSSTILITPHRIILDLTYLKAEVVPCFPEKYAIMDTFRNQYERHLVQQIGTLYQVKTGYLRNMICQSHRLCDDTCPVFCSCLFAFSVILQKGFVGLDQGELLQLMEWLDYYNQEIVNLGAVKPCPEFVQALSVCLQEYLVRVRNQV